MLTALRRLMAWQLGALGLVALVALLLGGAVAALAVGYGGGVAAVNLVLLRWRWQQGARDYHCDAQRHLKGFYRSSMERFFVVGILFAAWFAMVNSEAVAVLTGFLVTMLASIIAGRILCERT